jgi:hypothetical protein
MQNNTLTYNEMNKSMLYVLLISYYNDITIFTVMFMYNWVDVCGNNIKHISPKIEYAAEFESVKIVTYGMQKLWTRFTFWKWAVHVKMPLFV